MQKLKVHQYSMQHLEVHPFSATIFHPISASGLILRKKLRGPNVLFDEFVIFFCKVLFCLISKKEIVLCCCAVPQCTRAKSMPQRKQRKS